MCVPLVAYRSAWVTVPFLLLHPLPFMMLVLQPSSARLHKTASMVDIPVLRLLHALPPSCRRNVASPIPAGDDVCGQQRGRHRAGHAAVCKRAAEARVSERQVLCVALHLALLFLWSEARASRTQGLLFSDLHSARQVPCVYKSQAVQQVVRRPNFIPPWPR